MKRIFISVSVLLIFAPIALNDAAAQPRKTINQAVVDGDIEQVKSQISEGTDVNTKNRMGWTLLHTAIRNRQTEIVTFLIEKGADVNAKDNRSRTPLHAAVETGQKSVAEQLIAKRAEINVMDSRADNALSLAKKNNQKEIVELLVKNGAQDPDPSELTGNRAYYSQAANRNPAPGRLTQPAARTANVNQSSPAIDLLADPNEIKDRIKKFTGLKKSIKEVSDKSQNVSRHWQQTRYDNRTILATYMDKQIEDEINFIRKVAVEESAKKTIEAIDNLLKNRQKRSSQISKALHEQRREQKLAESARSRTRGRTTGRNTRGRTSIRGRAYNTNPADPYNRGAANIQPGQVSERENRPQEQTDAETQQQIRLWLQTNTENKLKLARDLHPKIQAEIASIRSITVEEQAKKTTAAIDGILLARKNRFDQVVKKIEEEISKQQARNLRNSDNESNQPYQQNSRYRGRTSRRTAGRGNLQQQNNTRRTRGRRR